MKTKKKPKKWIQGAIRRPGAFSAMAKKNHMTTRQFASHVLANKGKYSTRVIREAALAEKLMSMHHGKKTKKK